MPKHGKIRLLKYQTAFRNRCRRLIDDWAAYVDLKSDGQAYLYQTYDLETEEVYKDGAGSEYLGEYYSVHVSEMWEDHSVSWSTFYVSVNFDKVLWKDMVGLADSEFEVYTFIRGVEKFVVLSKP